MRFYAALKTGHSYTDIEITSDRWQWRPRAGGGSTHVLRRHAFLAWGCAVLMWRWHRRAL
jgi:hypothetical protein